MCLIFLDMLSPTAQEFCTDEFRGSSALVWGSQICDISTCDDPDVVAGAIPDVPRAHRDLHISQKSLHCHTPHVAQGRKSPAMTLVAFKKSPFLFLSILLTHLSRDVKNEGQNRKRGKKKKDKNKIQ